MDVTSNKQKWVPVGLNADLAKEVDRVIQRTKVHGVPRYNSRAGFVQEAVLALLQTQKAQAVSKGKQQRGEEILVARK